MKIPAQYAALQFDAHGAALAKANHAAKQARAQQTQISNSSGFSSLVQAAALPAQPLQAGSPLAASRTIAEQAGVGQSRIDQAVQGLDGALIRNMLESMQSSQSTSLFGEGTAGSVWKSMFTDVLSEKLAQTSFTGLGDVIKSSLPGAAPASTRVSLTNAPDPGLQGRELDSLSGTSEPDAEPADTLLSVFSRFWQQLTSILNASHPAPDASEPWR